MIVTGDDLGLTHAANVGVYDALRHGLATSASLMVPVPWARDAAAGYRGEDVGVHLTLNAEWDTYRWGPITHSPSLLDGDGGFPRTLEDLWDHADLDEVRRECRAQIERAIFWGFDVSHLDSHLGALLGRPEFFDVYLELAVDFGLPLRLAGRGRRADRRLPVPQAGGRGGRRVPRPLVVRGPAGSAPGGRSSGRCSTSPPASPRSAHPAIDTDELRAACHDWPGRVEDHASSATTRPPRPGRAGRARADRLPGPPRPPARREELGGPLGGGAPRCSSTPCLPDLLLEGPVLRRVGEGQQRHELGHVAGDLHPALHEGGVGVELALSGSSWRRRSVMVRVKSASATSPSCESRSFPSSRTR